MEIANGKRHTAAVRGATAFTLTKVVPLCRTETIFDSFCFIIFLGFMV
jgi:hypothetical protein